MSPALAGYAAAMLTEDARPVLLDLFSGGGGSAEGYRRAGFRVTGVDIEDHSRAFARIGCEFRQLDWREGLRRLAHLADAVTASPPCQRYSRASICRPGLAARYPDLIAPVRAALRAAGLPYVIENVPGAPLIDPVMLCGSMFGLRAEFAPHGTVGLQRHRLFESNVSLAAPAACRHDRPALRVFGHGRPGNSALTGPGYAQASRDVMGIWWMTRDQLDEAIPPAYAEHAGRQLMAALTGQARAA
jgi:DNA (cytosine-5)-methyltransferase 1